MIHNKFRYLLTLVALFALTAGAWAQEETLLTTITPTGDGTYSETTAGAVTVTPAGSFVYSGSYYGWRWDSYGSLTVTANEGYTITRCVFIQQGKNQSVTISEAPFALNFEEYLCLENTSMDGVTSIEVYGTAPAAPAGPEVTWDAETKTGTFTMPGSDVVLTPIYSEATITRGGDTPSETAYASLKEAFANVQDGDVIKLDWDVKLTETVTTPSTASGISFTLDFNGHTIDGSAGTNYIIIDNGCELTLTDNTATQMGGLKCQYPIAGSNGGKVIFQGGRYSFNGCSSSEIALEWDGLVSNYGWVMGDGKEFVDLNNGNLDDDGFPIRVDWKAIELTIGAGRFATFYSDQNTTLADGTDANIGLYTINGEGINLANNTVTVTKVNDPIAIAGMPLLVYNGTTEQKTVTLRVTPDQPTAGQMWSLHFQGTATDKTFDADDMAKADYYALSGGKAFAPVRGTGTIAKNKCWLQFDHETNGSAPARQLTIVFDNETTGVNEVIEVNEVSDDTLYDLNGRKLNGIPTKKGVYIFNGRKVVIK